MERTIKYKRILLKLSGEAMGGADGLGIHPEQAELVAKIIAEVRQLNVDVAIVIAVWTAPRPITWACWQP
jgi:uridylate kinase